MKIIICNIPLRGEASVFPPVGVTRVIESLWDAGYSNVEFYNTDLLRPTEAEMIEHFLEAKPDIIGISAVVSTSYTFVNTFSNNIKKEIKDVSIILGGNMAVSSNILLRKCGIDICCMGEGEKPIVEICKYWQRYGAFRDDESLKHIKGIAFKDRQNKIVFTGYGSQLPADEIRLPNYELLGEYYLRDIQERLQKRSEVIDYNLNLEMQRIDKKDAILELAKGCVNRCSFCHRWSMGYRVLPIDYVIEYIKMLINKYNVGVITVGDENFGSSKRYTDEFIDEIKNIDVLWRVGGMRAKTITSELAKKMKEAGCIAVLFGIESGSDKMLKVMDKNCTVDDNINAIRALAENNLNTAIQLVIGMPGENNETVQETIDFLKTIKKIIGVKRLPMSINYAQTLPGTPLYEYAKAAGFIGPTFEEEEQYLVKISNTDAAGFEHFINMTEEKTSNVMFWRILIQREVNGFFFSNVKGANTIVNKLIALLENVFGKKLVGRLIQVVIVYREFRNIKKALACLLERKKVKLIKGQSLSKTVNELLSGSKASTVLG